MRAIRDHMVPGDLPQNQIAITVTDEPGAGGANHSYHIDWIPLALEDNAVPNAVDIQFQKGPIREVGLNGITNEALLAIVIDRLRSFQAGPFRCDDNDDALGNCKAALASLQRRTMERLARGVEGLNKA